MLINLINIDVVIQILHVLTRRNTVENKKIMETLQRIKTLLVSLGLANLDME